MSNIKEANSGLIEKSTGRKIKSQLDISQEDVCNAIKNGGEYKWSTDYPHDDNSVTMADFLDFSLPDEYEVNLIDESYAEIKEIRSGNRYSIEASGDGDFCNHMVRFTRI